MIVADSRNLTHSVVVARLVAFVFRVKIVKVLFPNVYVLEIPDMQ